ncbi:MAG: GGDEF domain-containing protein [Trueperaceae bacterium]|jgi:diguanylate cyclase (GGDEF)-like protein
MQTKVEVPSVTGEAIWSQYFKRAPHGMVLFRVVRKPGGGLDDFEWADMNPSAAHAFALPADHLVGSRARRSHPEHLDPRIYRRLVLAHVSNTVQEFEQPYPWSEDDDLEAGRDAHPRRDVVWYAVTVIPLEDDHLVVQFRSISHYKSVLKQAVELLNRDDLTGLANRRHVKSRFWVLRRRAMPMALLYFDLNGFKAVNDTYGHEVGDKVLSIIGHRLMENVRPEEIVARLGGDEFAVLLAGPEFGAVDRVTERLLTAIEEPIALDEGVVRLSASVGAATFPEDAESFEALVSRADARMYEQKRSRAAAH